MTVDDKIGAAIPTLSGEQIMSYGYKHRQSC